MRIAMLGSGRVGRVLGAGFAERGHDVVMGTRDSASDVVCAWLAQSGPDTRATSYAEAAEWAEVAVFVPSWLGAESAAGLTGAGNVAGKPVIDVTNPFGTLADGTFGLTVGRTDSAGETVQRWFPDALVVKAFNSVGVQHMVDPDFDGGPPSMPIGGNDDGAKTVAVRLLRELGWDTADLGGIEAARSIESIALAWIEFGRVRGGQWHHAWKMLG